MKRRTYIKFLTFIFLFFALGGCKLPPSYQSKELLTNELYVVKVNDKYGVIDLNEVVVVPIAFSGIYYSPELDLIEARSGKYHDENYGLFDKNGKRIMTVMYQRLEGYTYETDTVIIASNIGHEKKNLALYNKRGKQISKNYSSIWGLSEGLFVAQNEYGDARNFHLKAGYIDTKGNEVIPAILEWALPFEYGLAAVRYDGYFGFIDRSGKEVIPFIFDRAESFHHPLYFSSIFSFPLNDDELLAAVCFNRKWGFINKKGEQVIPFKYDKIGKRFLNSKVQVQIKAERFFIDTNGQRVISNDNFGSHNLIND